MRLDRPRADRPPRRAQLQPPFRAHPAHHPCRVRATGASSPSPAGLAGAGPAGESAGPAAAVVPCRQHCAPGRDRQPGHQRTQAPQSCSLAATLLPGRWRHQVHVDHFQPEAGDPLHEPGESSLIGQLSAKCCGARADGDLAVLELRPQCGARLTRESDLVYLWSHRGHASQSAGSACRQHAGRRGPRHHPPKGEPGPGCRWACKYWVRFPDATRTVSVHTPLMLIIWQVIVPDPTIGG